MVVCLVWLAGQTVMAPSRTLSLMRAGVSPLQLRHVHVHRSVWALWGLLPAVCTLGPLRCWKNAPRSNMHARCNPSAPFGSSACNPSPLFFPHRPLSVPPHAACAASPGRRSQQQGAWAWRTRCGDRAWQWCWAGGTRGRGCCHRKQQSYRCVWLSPGGGVHVCMCAGCYTCLPTQEA